MTNSNQQMVAREIFKMAEEDSHLMSAFALLQFTMLRNGPYRTPEQRDLMAALMQVAEARIVAEAERRLAFGIL